ncbi:MAG: hypothetical protein JW720_11960 [Sedimentisphaerales bacterium]|nr:hypothetical protein [Sedimentisphaerales bacterium]
MSKRALSLSALLIVAAAGVAGYCQSTGPSEGAANAGLAGIERVYVAVSVRTSEPNGLGVDVRKIEALTAKKLTAGGIATVSEEIDSGMAEALSKRLGEMRNLKLRRADIPELQIEILIGRSDGGEEAAFCVQTSLRRAVILREDRNIAVKAAVWSGGGGIRFSSPSTAAEDITKAVLTDAGIFIAACNKAAKAEGEPGGTALAASQAGNEGAESQVTGQGFVASKNSKVFHQPGCSSVKRIADKNLVRYESRDAAIKAGKRPCKICKP